MDQFGICPLRPTARAQIDLIRKAAYGNWDGNAIGRVAETLQASDQREDHSRAPELLCAASGTLDAQALDGFVLTGYALSRCGLTHDKFRMGFDIPHEGGNDFTFVEYINQSALLNITDGNDGPWNDADESRRISCVVANCEKWSTDTIVHMIGPNRIAPWSTSSS